MSRRTLRHRRSFCLDLPADALRRLAGELVTLHGRHLAEGFALLGSSAVWRTSNGSLTARFVYRHPNRCTIAYTIRGVRAA
jgi:hypothetical protein